MTSTTHWYVRRKGRVAGPYPAAQIRRYVLLGRIRLDDELSHDRETWITARQYKASLSPAERRLKPADDERSGEDRRHSKEGDPGRHPRGPDRRRPEDEVSVERRERRQRVIRSLWQQHESYRVPVLVTVLLVCAIIVLGYVLAPGERRQRADCSAPPAPGVNWANCVLPGVELAEKDLTGAILRNSHLVRGNLFAARLRGADLAYSQLQLANLSYADLQGASLKGAILKQADLSNANLGEADLSYADLTGARIGGAELAGARLDNAIWVDGHPCPRAAVGGCPGPAAQPSSPKDSVE
ncbi:MAG: pentapeptide repeat-containing protein [Gammaproteobacteria bacterium]|nr:MAG: pentapeptide repeat-containing protein [Gammaproteobacteria bacterium]